MRKTITVSHTGMGGDIRVKKSDINEYGATAAEIAAEIIARREYGRRGVVGALRPDGYNDSYSTYEAFVGERGDHRTRGGIGAGISGHNVWIYVPQE